jgi:hypothetical protein
LGIRGLVIKEDAFVELCTVGGFLTRGLEEPD